MSSWVREAGRRSGSLWLLAVAAIVLLALWPAVVRQRADDAQRAAASDATPATPDYQRRDALIAFWEGAVREHHTSDMLSPRELAGQYLQRYRERGDVGDVVRARASLERSLAIQPRNLAAIVEMASVMLTLHRFRDALHGIDEAVAYDPTGPAFLSQRASLLMELGRYAEARATLARIRPDGRNSVEAETVRSRYDELTGHLSRARALLNDATARFDLADPGAAQSRAWYRFRAGELAFEAGDGDAAIADERRALALFPTYNMALKDLAKFELANHDYASAFAAAEQGAQVTPFPETLGYEADAQAALGRTEDAKATRDLIFAIERIGNAYRLSDRLLAVYYADHRLRPQTALAIASREAKLRGDEIYAQDTLAWAAAMDGRWNEARAASAKATRFDTEDALVQFHAGAIARHFGDRAEAEHRLRRALALNPHFHPVFADEARHMLAILAPPGSRRLLSAETSRSSGSP